MWKKILLAVAAIVAVLVAFVATRPDDYRVVRSVVVAAPPAAAYAQVADFHRWEAWSPWAKLDPAMKTDHGGPPSGPGATYHWVGDKSGEGRMTITGARPDTELGIRLEFVKPMQDVAAVTFRFAPEGAETRVTWEMSGKLGFIGKAMCLVKSMDGMIGPDFERGLASLKRFAEAEPRPTASAGEAAK